MLDPDDFLPAGVHEGYRKNLTELFCGKAGVEKIDSTAMARLPNLEVLWLNDNLLSKLQGLDYNFRLKHLYLHNNCMRDSLPRGAAHPSSPQDSGSDQARLNSSRVESSKQVKRRGT